MSKRFHNSGTSVEEGGDDEIETVGSPAKVQELEVCASTDDHVTTITCSLPPHEQLTFHSLDDFDIHYAKEHTNRCTSCGRNLPSAHFLSLHLDENHNPLREELAAKGEKTFSCFVEGCDRKCSTSQKRRRHLIDKHMFPKSYNFRVVDKGIDHTISMLQGGQKRRLSTATNLHRRKSSTAENHVGKADDGKSDNSSTVEKLDQTKNFLSNEQDISRISGKEPLDVDGLENAMAALNFVPPSVLARQRSKKPGK